MAMLQVGRLLLAAVLAFGVGKVARLGCPLFWAGLSRAWRWPACTGPVAERCAGFRWFSAAESILECTVGLMIGTELLWDKLKRQGNKL